MRPATPSTRPVLAPTPARPDGCTQAGVLNNLFATGGANTITWTPVTDADTYNVYKFQGGLYGYIGQTAGTSFIDDNIAPDLSKTPPIYESVFRYRRLPGRRGLLRTAAGVRRHRQRPAKF